MRGVNQFREGGACKWLCRAHRKLLPSHPWGLSLAPGRGLRAAGEAEAVATSHQLVGQEWKRDLGRQRAFPNRLPKDPILPQRENTSVDSDISSSSSS